MLDKLASDYKDLLARCVELEKKYKDLSKQYDYVLAKLKELSN